MSPNLLACSGVSMRFGGVTALDGVSLEFPVGQVTGVIGPNGSGKSTLFNVLSAELRPSSGEVRWDGERIGGLAMHEAARRGVVRTYQSASVFPQVSVLESMSFAHRLARGRGGPSLADVANLTGLEPYLGESGGALPYGHQKILGVALALLTAPRMLLLDEPAAGLNQAEVTRFLELIRRIRETGNIGIGIIDHDMSLIMPACDRIAVLNFGQLVAFGKPADIQADPAVLDLYLSGDLRHAGS